VAIPDLATARRVLDDEQLPGGVIVHSEGVRRVATAAARLVARSGVPIDVDLVAAAALLHDIDKVRTRRDGGEHGIVGARMLTALGYDELAIPVASHPISCLLDDERFPIGWPSVILAVADRHVAQEFVTIDERLDDMARRHPTHAEQIRAAAPAAHALDAQLAEVVGMAVPEVVNRLRAAWNDVTA
jgi:putative nucleotidyltransferase with HDIG domain